MQANKVMMGKLPRAWGNSAKSITFCVTEECNLACKYCYMTGKNNRNKMSFDIAKKAVDYFLSNRELFNEESVVWDFIGGEPFLEIDLIDKVCDYIKQQMFLLDHPWFNSYRISFTTNGMLYGTQKVQNFIKKNKNHLSISVSIDGNKMKHDLQRIKPDGRGSYDDVMKIVPLWQSQFPGTDTKATFAHEDLPYLKDSIISLWNIGINYVSANVVFEDVWHEGDDVIFENQLKSLGDYIIENELWKNYSVRFFDPKIGFPLMKDNLSRNYCGAGKMIAVDYKGDLFPCIRFTDFTLNNKEGVCIGNVVAGINLDKLRPFKALTLANQSKSECINCDVAAGCAWCTGFNYDASESDTIYSRATYVCKMHKANVRANEYFWDKLSKTIGIENPRDNQRKLRDIQNVEQEIVKDKFLFFILLDDITPHCNYINWQGTKNKMSRNVFSKGMEFCKENNFIPVFLGSEGVDEGKGIRLVNSKAKNIQDDNIVIYDDNIAGRSLNLDNCILLVSKKNIKNLFTFIKELYPNKQRINLILKDIDKWETKEVKAYENQLQMVADFIFDTYKQGSPIELNVLTDIMNLESMYNCDCGITTFALAPNGKIYICPAFYFDNPNDSIGDIRNGIKIKNKELLKLEKAPICSICDAYHCRRCRYLNKKLTNEINTPSKIQCVIGHTERKIAMYLQKKLIKGKYTTSQNILAKIDYLDPLDKIVNQ